MKLKYIFLLLFISVVGFVNAQTAEYNGFLKTYVSPNGQVDYAGMKADRSALDNYLNYLAATTPDSSWSADKTKAFWINAYNAYTIDLILDNYPLKSITDLSFKGKGAWDYEFAEIGQKKYSLNYIEKDYLLPTFNDPRIHVGVNCASYSCPILGNFAFTESNVDGKLENLMKVFINDKSRNVINEKKTQLSEIFKWYPSDFTSTGSLVDFINKYSDTKITSKTKISYLPYKWNLNGK